MNPDRWQDQYARYAAAIGTLAATGSAGTGPFDPAWLAANRIDPADLRILARSIAMRLEYADPAVRDLSARADALYGQWQRDPHQRTPTT